MATPPGMTPLRLSLLLSVMLSGCFLSSSSSEDFDTRGDYHNVTLNWHIKNVDDSPAACPAGFTTMFIHMYVLGYAEPADSLFQLPCASDGSITKPIATSGYFVPEDQRDLSVPGKYPYSPLKDFWVDISEETYTKKAAVSFERHVESLDGDMTVDFDIYPAGGVGVLAWRLLSAGSGAPLSSCQTAGVDTVEAALRPYDDDTAPLQLAGSWPCDKADPFFYYNPVGNSTLIDPNNYQLGSGHTHAVTPHDAGYYVELRALHGGQIVGTAPSSFYPPSMNGADTLSKYEIPITNL